MSKNPVYYLPKITVVYFHLDYKEFEKEAVETLQYLSQRIFQHQ